MDRYIWMYMDRYIYGYIWIDIYMDIYGYIYIYTPPQVGYRGYYMRPR